GQSLNESLRHHHVLLRAGAGHRDPATGVHITLISLASTITAPGTVCRGSALPSDTAAGTAPPARTTTSEPGAMRSSVRRSPPRRIFVADDVRTTVPSVRTIWFA